MKQALGLTNDFSIQLAIYPGSGEGYTRHLDAFKTQEKTQEKGDTKGDKDAQSSTNKTDKSRQLTFLYYLNQEVNGGILRAYRPITSTRDTPEYVHTEPEYVDIEPKMGRLVVSECGLCGFCGQVSCVVSLPITLYALPSYRYIVVYMWCELA